VKMKSRLLGIVICFLVALTLFPPPAFSDEVDGLYEKAAGKYHELYKSTPFREKADNWLQTIKQFQLIYKNYPRHPQSAKSLFNIGNLYRSLYQLNKKEVYLDRSNIHFRKLVTEYPRSTLADDAQFNIGDNYENLKKDPDLAQLEYQKVLDLFPNSNAAEKAQEKLKSFHSAQDFGLEPDLEKTKTPEDLTTPRYGGLSEAESIKHQPILVSKIDYWSTTDWSRMVINVKGELRYKYQLLKEDKKHRQKRLYIDLYNSYIPSKFKKKIAANDGLISQARIAQFDKETVRIVLDMESIKRIKVFHFDLPNQHKIVVDVLGDSSLMAANGKDPQQTISYDKPKPESNEDGRVSLLKALGLKVKTIIVDPGHGGKDPGASAFDLKEKDIVLDIAKNLRGLIRKNHPNIKVLLTRETDCFIELEARTAFANQHKGDLFLSIHVNASIRPKLAGAETYFLNLTTDDEALSLAAKENQTSLKSISDLQTILNDLMINSKINESRDLAETVQASMIHITGNSNHGLRNLGVKQAPFTVLIGAQMPSILIEAGFLTNKTENQFLKTSDYKKTLASGIYRGIKDYMD
jgi:N-acetylmuramoyl-L-alanine amidase